MNQNNWSPEKGENQNGNENNQAGSGGNWNNNKNDGRIGPLPANINEVNPIASADAQSITKLIKSGGRIVGYELSNGQQISREQGVQMAKKGQISSVAVATNKGTEYLRGFADGSERNNLDSLPSITQ